MLTSTAITKADMLNMIWTAFEIAINIFQGYLILMYVKQCFTYEKKHPIADVLLVCSCAGFLSYFLFFDYILYLDYLLFLFPTVYAFLFSSERKISIAYWIAVLFFIFVSVPKHYFHFSNFPQPSCNISSPPNSQNSFFVQ